MFVTDFQNLIFIFSFFVSYTLSDPQLDIYPYNSVGRDYNTNTPYNVNQNPYNIDRNTNNNNNNVNQNPYNVNQDINRNNNYDRTLSYNEQDDPNTQVPFNRDNTINRSNLPYNGDIRALLQALDIQASQQCTNNVAAQWNFETNVNQVTQLEAVSTYFY